MTIKTKADLTTDLNTDIPDNNTALVSPADVRDNVINVVDSALTITTAPTGGKLIETSGTVGETTESTATTADITGSVTVHSDVSSAGSGSIITAGERTNITGSVTVHSDVTDAGSGAIITALERGHFTNTANPHATDIGNLGSGTLAELNTALTDATLEDGSAFVHIAGAETITGEKTFSASKIIATNAGFQFATAGNFNLMRDTAGKSKLVLTANGAFVAEFVMQYGNDVNASRTIVQQSTSTQITYGSSVANVYYNVTGDDVNHVFRGDTDNNLLTTDASQDAVGVGVATPSASAKLQVDSTTKGFLPPRVTEVQRDAIASPADGLIVYNTDADEPQYYDGTTWSSFAGGAGGARYGEAYISSSSATSIGTVNTPVKVAGTTTAGELSNFTMPSNNRLTYTGAETTIFNVMVSASMTSGANNKLYSLYIAKNGTVLTKSKISRFVASGGDQGAVAVSSLVSLATNDYVELWIENNTDTTNPTITAMNLSAK